MPSVECGFPDRDGLPGGVQLAARGPTISVRIGFDPDFSPSVGGLPSIPTRPLPALIDTGASASCVDARLAADLRLPVVERASVAGVHGAGSADLYLAQIHVPSLGVSIAGRFAGARLEAGGQEHRALIGRDFLMYFTMIYNGITGEVRLSNEGS